VAKKGKSMDLKDKIVGLALAALIALVGWNLKETWTMKEQVFKLQQGQVILSKQIKKNTNFVKKKLKQIQKKNLKKKKKKKKTDESLQ
jgi:hypothetical protein